MKARLHSLGVALGFVTLALVWIPGPLNRDTFYWAGRPIALFLPSIFDFVFAWLVLAVVLHRIRRPGRARSFIWSLMLAFAPILAIEAYALLPGTYVSGKLRLTVGLLCLLLWLLLRTVLSGFFARHAERIIGVASVFLLFLSLNGVYVVSHGLWLGWQARHLNSFPPYDAALRPLPPGRPHIVWIVMDELSYNQVYAHRPAGLSLPAFDALAAQSSVFTNTTPAANMTEFAMPDYMTGIPVGHDFYAPDGHLDLGRLDNLQRVPFDPHNTIFQDARNDGYNTGISGWFIPYCRLLSGVVDRCYWSYTEPNRNGMIATGSIRSNLTAPIRRILAYAVPTRLHTPWFNLDSNGVLERQQHIADCQRIVVEADRMIRDRNVDFLLLHIPVPHLPGIYDSQRSAVSSDKAFGYVANLALADQCLAHLRATLESTGQWDNATVLVMGDHSWRLGEETPADRIAASIGFDPRPAYIVKLAGQQQPAAINASYDALRTRSLLQALLQQQIHTSADLAAWVERKP